MEKSLPKSNKKNKAMAPRIKLSRQPLSKFLKRLAGVISDSQNSSRETWKTGYAEPSEPEPDYFDFLPFLATSAGILSSRHQPQAAHFAPANYLFCPEPGEP